MLPQNDNHFEFFTFHHNGKPLENAPVCGLTLKQAGTMRFRWTESNPNRDKVLHNVRWLSLSKQPQTTSNTEKTIVPIQLNHTHIVYNIKNPSDTRDKIGDGLITTNPALIPTVTVADCMPLYLYDPITKVFGIVHSGWKGTGIVTDAITLAEKEYDSKPQDFHIVLGPHIRSCCYIVNEERARWFSENFTPACVTPLEPGIEVSWNTGGGPLYRLSLEKANLAALKNKGVPEENIWIHPACTCCFKEYNNYKYGSNRRETQENGKPDAFTVQAAFIISER